MHDFAIAYAIEAKNVSSLCCSQTLFSVTQIMIVDHDYDNKHITHNCMKSMDIMQVLMQKGCATQLRFCNNEKTFLEDKTFIITIIRTATPALEDNTSRCPFPGLLIALGNVNV